ncbi:hypothetical protein C8J55DRAFT_526211 [Lentinula edodes]|uniref:Uncharacterized protein n=1 Tax=Lentinula lateritia TaxID=40482 RepID=A0A9W8ZW49_9AGAR|nr:hypothetical protein C8J55DRAFT_526211 [Lentinula edodes]
MSTVNINSSSQPLCPMLLCFVCIIKTSSFPECHMHLSSIFDFTTSNDEPGCVHTSISVQLKSLSTFIFRASYLTHIASEILHLLFIDIELYSHLELGGRLPRISPYITTQITF